MKNSFLIWYLYIIIVTIFYLTISVYPEMYTNNKLNTDFDIYVINLPSSKERLVHFIDQYNNTDLVSTNINVFSAVNGKTLELEKYVTPSAYEQIILTEKTNKRKYHYELTRGAVGCYLSHLEIYKKIAESDKKYGLIFEDDVILHHNFGKLMLDGIHNINNIDPDWDIFLLGIMCIDCKTNTNYIDVKRFWGLHGYLVKKESAIKLVSLLDKLISKQIDAEISLMIKYQKLKVYSIYPSIVIQSNQFGTMQTTVDTSSEAFKEEFV